MTLRASVTSPVKEQHHLCKTVYALLMTNVYKNYKKYIIRLFIGLGKNEIREKMSPYFAH